MATKAKIKRERPLLSVGIIFKNEIRCLERCLKSLQPLRERITMELVMADTGSTDGSREIAAKYADVLFDFPWINDFSAARNAVLDRCSGHWCLMVDSDEWLDGEFSQLVEFLTDQNQAYRDCCRGGLIIRNFHDKELFGYSDLMALRLLKLSRRPRYEGAIHESPMFPDGARGTALLGHTVLKHDGYVMLNYDTKEGAEKRRRNLQMLQEELAKDPENLRLHLLYLESDGDASDYEERLRAAMELVREKKKNWEFFGAPIFRYGVFFAARSNNKEMEKWGNEAKELFPDSYFTRVDVEWMLASMALDRGRDEYGIPRAEAALHAAEELKDKVDGLSDIGLSRLQRESPYWRQALKIALIAAYARNGCPEKAAAQMDGFDYTILDGQWTEELVKALTQLHTRTDCDTAPLIETFWDGICKSAPNEEKAKEREEAFVEQANLLLALQPDASEQRPAWSLFLPLAGKCAPGDLAAMLNADDSGALTALLARQEELAKLPSKVLFHALEYGATFPPSESLMPMEALDAVAANLAKEPERLRAYALSLAAGDFAADWQSLDWTRAAVMAAVRGFDWNGAGGDGLALAKAFAAVERVYLPRCYTPEALDVLAVLPPLHRAGLCCARAFAALDGGDPAGYVRILREGLESCPEMKAMTEFLLGQVERLTAPPELLQLAEQVKALLAKYPADDPAVAELKNSPAYQKVAYLIEG